MTALLLNNRLH